MQLTEDTGYDTLISRDQDRLESIGGSQPILMTMLLELGVRVETGAMHHAVRWPNIPAVKQGRKCCKSCYKNAHVYKDNDPSLKRQLNICHSM